MAPGAKAGAQLFTAAEINAAISTSPRIQAAGMARAQHAQSIWRQFIPDFDPGRSRRNAPPRGKPGDAKASLRIEVVRRGFHIAWRVGSDSFLVRMMEFGSKHMPKLAGREKAIASLRTG